MPSTELALRPPDMLTFPWIEVQPIAQPLLKIINLTPSEYLHHLKTIPQFPPQPEVLLLSNVAQSLQPRVPIHRDPPRYLKHLQETPQLPAPPEYKLLDAGKSKERASPVVLAARSTFTSDAEAHTAFEDFLTQEKVYQMAQRFGWTKTGILDPDDIAQMVVIHLWQQWWTGDEPIRRIKLRFAIREICSHNKWNWRIKYGKTPTLTAIETAAPASTLLEVEGEDENYGLDLFRMPHFGEDIRGTEEVDRRMDIMEAIETITLYMMFVESLKKPRQRTQPHIVPKHLETLFKGYMYYRQAGSIGEIGGRHNSQLKHYWQENGLHNGAGQKWRKRVFPFMASLLAEYEPLPLKN